MEILGGFMVMAVIIGSFLAAVWFVTPFVVFSIKGKQEKTLVLLESIEKRLDSIEASLAAVKQEEVLSVPEPSPLTGGATPSDDDSKNGTDV